LFLLDRATSISPQMFRCFPSSRLTGFEWSSKSRGVVPTVALEMNPQDSLRFPDFNPVPPGAPRPIYPL